ncbi:MAG TPA: NAD(P)H-binding protein [Thermoleophilaceae bacterium]
MSGSVLVMGATGNVGGATLAALRESGVDAVAFVRDPQRAADVLGADQKLRVGDLAHAGSVAAALDGVERVLLCSGNDPALREQQLSAVDAIASSDVQRVVKISASPVATRADSPSRVGRDHAAVEHALRVTRREVVAIRPNVFMQSFYAQVPAIANGVLPGPERGRVSFIDAGDIGRVAAAALIADQAPAPILELTGPQAYTWFEVAELMSSALGRPITHLPTPTDALAQGMRALGRPEWLVEHVLELAVLMSEPKAAEVTDTVEDVTGRPPRSLTEFLTDNASAFAAAA